LIKKKKKKKKEKNGKKKETIISRSMKLKSRREVKDEMKVESKNNEF
jgi:hypothetical protein